LCLGRNSQNIDAVGKPLPKVRGVSAMELSYYDSVPGRRQQ
jgi:hypothetical protein